MDGYTYQDAVDVLVDYLGGNVAASASRDIRRAVQESYDDLCGRRRWSHFQRPHRLEVYAPVEVTASYDETTNLFTIGSGSWPAWAEGATISDGVTRYRIKERTSSTALTPTATQSPTGDLSSRTMTIYKDIITLPEEFMELDQPLGQSGSAVFAEYIPPARWMEFARFSDATGESCYWTVMADPVYTGRQAVHLWPAPHDAGTIDFLGKFYPRRIKLTGHLPAERSGTISVSGSTVTGVGTAFRSDMVGSALRISIDGTSCPEGLGGLNPYQYQRIITGYSSATSITIGGATVGTVTSKKYTISDPLDIARHMYTAVLRGAERRVAHKKGTSAVPLAEQAYAAALADAMADDSPSMTGASCWDAMQRRGFRQTWVQGGDA
jgi:hypothetical protein